MRNLHNSEFAWDSGREDDGKRMRWWVRFGFGLGF